MAQTTTGHGFDPGVDTIQHRLTDLGLLAAGHSPGHLDDVTRAALRTVQRVHGLPATGELDAPTDAVLGNGLCGAVIADLVGHAAGSRAGRSGPVAEFTVPVGNTAWPKTELTYRVGALPPGWNARDLVTGINRALAAWAAVTPLRFEPAVSDPDILFSFTGIIPGNPPTPMPTWANAWASGNVVTFNPTKTYSAQPLPLPAGTVDMEHVTLHELGHILGLGHATNRESVMYPVTQPGLRSLSSDDVEGVQSLYGGRPVPVPGWFGDTTAAADLAVVDLSGTGSLDVVVGHVDNPGGADQAYYRIGFELDRLAHPALGWGPVLAIGGPLGHETQGMALAAADLTGSGRPDLVAVFMDNPSGTNNVFYRIGRDLDTSGFTANWSVDIPVPGSWGHESAGMAAALWDLDGSGLPDLVLAWIDNPDGGNAVHYRIGRNIDASGTAVIWTDPIQIQGGMGDESSGLGLALTDVAGNGLPDMTLFWVDNPSGANSGRLRFGRDVDGSGLPRHGWSSFADVPGWWGSDSAGAGAALISLTGLTRPDLLVLTIDAPDGAPNRGWYRLLAPSLPSWNPVRPSAPVGGPPLANAGRLAAVAPSADVYAVVARVDDAATTVSAATWDQVDLNENAGSDIIEFTAASLGAARADSPVAAAARLPTQADAFWIAADNRLRTSWATGLGVAGNTGPTWSAALQPGGAARARAGSPLAAASIDEDHIEAFFVGREDEIIGHRWNAGIGWAAAQLLYTAAWTRPTNALAAVRRPGRIFLFWSDADEAIWMGSVNDQDVAWPVQPIAGPGSIDAASGIAAVSVADDTVDLFWLAPGGRIMSSFGGSDGATWAVPFEVGGGHVAEPLCGLSAVQINRSGLQVFWAEPDMAVWSSFWSERPDGTAPPWTRPVAVTPPGTLQPGSDVAAATRAWGSVRVFVTEGSGNLADTWWGATP